MAAKGLGPLPRRRGSALAHGCDRGGRVVLPVARAAAVSTGVRVREVSARPAQGLVPAQVVHAEASRGRRVEGEQRQPCRGGAAEGRAPEAAGLVRVGVGVGVEFRVRVRG